MPIVHAQCARPSEPLQVEPDELARIYATQVRILRSANHDLRRQVCELTELVEDLDPTGEKRYELAWGYM